MGDKGFAKHGVYGDFVVGDGIGGGWGGKSTAGGASASESDRAAGRELFGGARIRVSGMGEHEQAVVRVLPGHRRQTEVTERTIAEMRNRALFTKQIVADTTIPLPELPEGEYTIYAGSFNGRSRSIGDALRSLRYTFRPIKISRNETTDLHMQLPGFGRAALWVSGLRRDENATVYVLAGDQSRSLIEALQAEKLDENAIREAERLSVFEKEIHSDTSVAVPELPEGTYTVIAGAYDGRAQSGVDALRSLRYTWELIEISENRTTDVPVVLENARTYTQG